MEIAQVMRRVVLASGLVASLFTTTPAAAHGDAGPTSRVDAPAPADASVNAHPGAGAGAGASAGASSSTSTSTAATAPASAPAIGTAASPPSGLDGALESQVRQLALSGTQASAAKADTHAGAPRIDISIGQLDPRLRLAPCQRIEPYVPDGVRMWGKARIGLRCLQGLAKWNVYLPVTVRVFGRALAATDGAAAGSVLTAADLTLAEVDLAEDASAPLFDAALAVGHVLARPLKPGQSLRQSHLKARQWFSAGETVTVLAQGDGFSVSGEAQALNNGIEGQPVRVRTEGGRVLTGVPVGERRVELGL